MDDDSGKDTTMMVKVAAALLEESSLIPCEIAIDGDSTAAMKSDDRHRNTSIKSQLYKLSEACSVGSQKPMEPAHDGSWLMRSYVNYPHAIEVKTDDRHRSTAVFHEMLRELSTHPNESAHKAQLDVLHSKKN